LESDEFQAGRAEGARWAAEEAEWIQLVNLADANRDEDGSVWEGTPLAPYDMVDVVLLAIDAEKFDDRFARESFREEYCLEGECSIDCLRGFVDGALEVMQEVAAEVEDGFPDDDASVGKG
jgi:hypothetical protein